MDSRRRVLLFAAMAAALVPLHLQLTALAFDDALIHVRIADHLRAGVGPYFNVGDAVMASSSSAWTLVLALLFGLSGNSALEAIAVLNALLTALCVPVYGALIRRSSGASSGLVSDLLATVTVVPVLLGSSIGLMETPLAILVGGLGLYCYQHGRPAAFAFLALAPFVRVELAVLGAAVGLAAVWEKRLRAMPAVAWAAAATIPMLAYDLSFFGTVVPSSIRAKSAGYVMSPLDSIWRLVPYVVDGWMSPQLVLVFPLALAAGALLVLKCPADSTARVSFVAGAIIAAAYVFAGAFIFEWYVPLYGVLLVWPLAAVILHPHAASRIVAVRVTAVVVVAALLAAAELGAARYVLAAVSNPASAPGFMQGARVRKYVATARMLFEVFPEEVLVTSEIGGLGYGFGGRIADGFGLVSPAAVKFHPMRVPQDRRDGTIGALPPGFVEEVNPALIVSYDIFCEALLQSDIAKAYVRVDLNPFAARDQALAKAAGVSQGLWGIKALHVFFRHDAYAKWLAARKPLE